ncbi:MAG: thioredoxin domain-containing protein [Planctomycetota bacterium]
MPFVRCSSPSDAIAAFDRLVREQNDALFLFFGSTDPGTGESWCPDCVVADPVLRRTLAANAPTLTVFECPVGARADWKGKMEHPYRTHPAFRVGRIPTLVRFRGGLEIGRLIEGPCADATAVTAFVG